MAGAFRMTVESGMLQSKVQSPKSKVQSPRPKGSSIPWALDFGLWTLTFVPWPPRRAALKEWQFDLVGRWLAALAPFGAVLDDPIRQRPLEADISTGFFRFDPLVF